MVVLDATWFDILRDRYEAEDLVESWCGRGLRFSLLGFEVIFLSLGMHEDLSKEWLRAKHNPLVLLLSRPWWLNNGGDIRHIANEYYEHYLV